MEGGSTERPYGQGIYKDAYLTKYKEMIYLHGTVQQRPEDAFCALGPTISSPCGQWRPPSHKTTRDTKPEETQNQKRRHTVETPISSRSQ
jgi:hypothetical protein